LKETVLRVSEQDRFRSSREREGGDTARRKVDAKREETVNALKIHMSLVGERGKKKQARYDENVESWEYSISAVKKGRKQRKMSGSATLLACDATTGRSRLLLGYEGIRNCGKAIGAKGAICTAPEIWARGQNEEED